MKPEVKGKPAVRLQQAFNGVLIVAVIVLLGALSVRYKTEFDWTANQRNTLTEGSVKLLSTLSGPITFHVFAPSGADTRRSIEQDLAKYLRHKADIRIEFIDPSVSPQKVREFEVRYVGDVVVDYQGRREHLSATTEQAISSALQRLAFAGETRVAFLQGHGERALDGADPAGLADFAAALKAKGIQTETLSLVSKPQIDPAVRVVVIASPTTGLLEGEQQILRDYLKGGGNLLWLADPDQPPGLDPLATDLGVQWQDGYAILPEYELLGTGHPGFFAAIGYPPNPVTQGFDQVTLFPLVRSLKTAGDAGWQAQPLLQTSESAWLETGSLESGQVAFDEGDQAGPLDIGMTLTRMRDGAEGKPVQQRVALIGDADFLTNAYVGELGNQALGVNLIQWLAARDAQLNIDIKKAPDTSLVLGSIAYISIAAGFVLLLPLGLLVFGVWRWLRRRRR